MTLSRLLLIFLLFISQSVFSDNHSDSDKLFDWAEKEYSQFFSPANQSSQIYNEWYYRYYPETENYVGVNTDDEVWVLGESWNNQMLYIDTLQKLMVDVDNDSNNVVVRPLNDTGITLCGNADNNNLSCPVADYPGQDAEYGRDVTHNDDSDGHAGFSFTKLDANGNALSASAISWSCVKDNVTGLIWEVKTNDGGLRDRDWTYTWYNSTGTNDGGLSGTLNGGSCSGSIRCDTEKYVHQVNAQSLCGASDWRMPDIKELENIKNLDEQNPAIDTNYFLNTVASGYWSASPFAYHSDFAWSVGFRYGFSLYDYKNGSKYARLVRTGQ